MKAINLLPPSERPRAVVAAPANASKIVLAVLGVLLIAVAAFVFTKNQTTDRRDAIAQAQQEKAEAEQRSQGLQSYGNFAKIKQTRVTSISELAAKRFDWERLMRELALVMPDKVWVTDVSGQTAGADPSASGSAPAAPAPAPTGTTSGSTGAAAPTSGGTSTTIKGCAPSQKAVAATIVRLRSLAGAEEVDLQSSTAPADAASSGGSDSAASGGDCGRYLSFSATIGFATTAGAKQAKSVPSRLGGGS